MEFEKGRGISLVKCGGVGAHKRHSRTVEIEDGRGLRSVECENAGTHK